MRLTPAGDVQAVLAPGDVRINQYQAGPHDAAPGGLFLRRATAHGIDAVALTGSRSTATYRVTDEWARWDGAGLGARWSVHLVLDPLRTAWVWRIDLAAEEGATGSCTWDVAFLQDLSLAPTDLAQSSEAYVSHYVAHRIEDDERVGRVVLSRQTMTTAPVLPLFAAAFAEGARAAGTDAFDLFGPEARAGETPRFQTGAPWPDRVRQHEAAMAGLLSRPLELTVPSTLHAVGLFWPDHRDPMADVMREVPGEVDRLARFAARVVAAPVPAGTPGVGDRSALADAPLVAGDRLDDAGLLALGTGARFGEYDDAGTLMSYFTGTGAHVVRGEKDLELVRPHGHVLLCGGSLDPDRPPLSTTVFAHGVVGSHTVLGNTSFDRFASVHRNHLNLLRSNGVRVLIRHGGRWVMLGRPSAFVLDVGEARWVYHLGDAQIEVRTAAAADRDVLLTEVRCSPAQDVVITTDVDLADGAWNARRAQSGNALIFRADTGTTVAEHHAALAYVLAASPEAHLGGDGIVFDDGQDRGTTVVTAHAPATCHVRIAVAADREGGAGAALAALKVVAAGLNASEHAAGHRRTLDRLTRGLRVGPQSRFAELEVLLPWWAHDARVHFLVPHGLEQYSGAAWGTRDVCQGPFELAIAAGRFTMARDILLRVFGRQERAGTFPQWFMFDDYDEVFQEHAHGDVMVWPMFALGQYLEATGDTGVLDAVVAFRDGGEATIAEHVGAQLDYQVAHRVPGTALPAYGDGDWDDTLQPARAEMRERMASSWTSALTCQALELLAAQLAAETDPARGALADRLSAIAAEVRADIARLLLPDGVVAGFVTVDDGAVTPVIHPRDDATGLTYRLISMTRMMIAGLLDDDEARAHEAIIRQHLHFPDGVRLVDAPVRFSDGMTHHFLRAEQAAFFGREVGLMYVHAHIRWVEALAALGRADVGTEMLRLSPIGMRERVPSALPRQRTCYTSSSDAVFPDRYTAHRDFGKLHTGGVRTADGWRVYSSGPGIFVRQVLHSLLGLEERADVLVVAPNLGQEDDGLTVELVLAGQTRTVRYRVDPRATGPEVRLDGQRAVTETQPLRYRTAAAVLDIRLLDDVTTLDVRVPPGT